MISDDIFEVITPADLSEVLAKDDGVYESDIFRILNEMGF